MCETPLCTLSEAVIIAIPGPRRLQKAVRDVLLPIWKVAVDNEMQKENIMFKKLMFHEGKYQMIRAMPIEFAKDFMKSWVETAFMKLDKEFEDDIAALHIAKQTLLKQEFAADENESYDLECNFLASCNGMSRF